MSTSIIYHERQVRELCALHALNNLFQRKEFSKEELDTICYSLSPDVWINPHKSILGLGNYDINVLMKALQSRGYEAVWFDKRKEPSCVNLQNVYGFILNVPSDYKFSFITLPLRRRHWVAIRNINGSYFNMDSKLDSPHIIGRENNVLEYLREELDHRDKQLFLVVTENVAYNQTWLLHPNRQVKKAVTERDAEIILLKDIETDDVNVTINPLCNNSISRDSSFS